MFIKTLLFLWHKYQSRPTCGIRAQVCAKDSSPEGETPVKEKLVGDGERVSYVMQQEAVTSCTLSWRSCTSQLSHVAERWGCRSSVYHASVKPTPPSRIATTENMYKRFCRELRSKKQRSDRLDQEGKFGREIIEIRDG
ncbi:hypothetical protein L1887_15906 [Cichorium endivia]|nr:hypothetical protein L1887_15906 [Cichorium endivia]